uniref:Uncharacterized protein n=1 Tax=Nelumbo nucifera TaxID=4432 RepID=A0A822ZCY7_NELNU|nr:TPA_asm: hypothetical protein HUJ06_015608 [Nelumbo nucifera]
MLPSTGVQRRTTSKIRLCRWCWIELAKWEVPIAGLYSKAVPITIPGISNLWPPTPSTITPSRTACPTLLAIVPPSSLSQSSIFADDASFVFQQETLLDIHCF